MITGASGFVGANLTRRLLQEGCETHLVVRPSYQPWRIQEIANSVQIHQVDLEDQPRVHRILAAVRPNWVFHLAAFGAYSSQTGMQRMVSTNLMGCVALLDACAKVGVEAFVQTGSSSEYGYKDHAATEEDLLEPNSHYAITKAAATHYCQFAARKLDVNAVTLRFYSIYGPYEEPTRFIPTLIVHGLRATLPRLVSPQIARDFVYVDDAVDALLQVAGTTSIPRGAVYNICSGAQASLADVVAVARKLMSISEEPAWSTMPERSWDTDRWVGSPARIESEIGWQAKIAFETGLKRTIEWFKEHPEWLHFYAVRIFPNPA